VIGIVDLFFNLGLYFYSGAGDLEGVSNKEIMELLLLLL
jgi:hypothetical protein